MSKYINERIWGVPKPNKKGGDTRVKHNLPPYVHKVDIDGYIKYKVHVKRGDVSKIKYFNTLQEACMFAEMLKLNPYL